MMDLFENSPGMNATERDFSFRCSFPIALAQHGAMKASKCVMKIKD